MNQSGAFTKWDRAILAGSNLFFGYRKEQLERERDQCNGHDVTDDDVATSNVSAEVVQVVLKSQILMNCVREGGKGCLCRNKVLKW